MPRVTLRRPRVLTDAALMSAAGLLIRTSVRLKLRLQPMSPCIADRLGALADLDQRAFPDCHPFINSDFTGTVYCATSRRRIFAFHKDVRSPEFPPDKSIPCKRDTASSNRPELAITMVCRIVQAQRGLWRNAHDQLWMSRIRVQR
jgi:hypothetical protein